MFRRATEPAQPGRERRSTWALRRALRRPNTGPARLAPLVAAAVAIAGCRVNTDADDASPRAAVAEDAAPREPGAEPVRILYPAAPGAFVDLAAEVGGSVVGLRSTRPVIGGPASQFPGVDDEHAIGSGFIIDRNGYIVTADGLVATAPDLRVRLADGSERDAEVVGRDPRLGVALLKIPASPKLRPLPLGDSDAAQVGAWVLAVGNPFGTGTAVSSGVVARVPVSSGAGLVAPRTDYYHLYLHTDARIHAGNAGGPLVNTAGEVIGINVVLSERASPVGFAVPINSARRVLPMLRADGRVTRAWLGVFVTPLTGELSARLGLDDDASGALVTKVMPRSPAAKAGVRRGDVVLRFDGRETDDKSLPWVASTAGIGRTIELVVWRDRAEQQLELVTEPVPQ